MHLQRKFLNFDITGVLGSGSYGDVLSAVDKITGMDVAIKFAKKDVDQWKNSFEPKIQLILDHENICKLYGCISTSRNLVLVLELVRGIDLHKYIRRNGRLSETHARSLFVQMLYGVDYLHSHSIVHRDLKLENIMISGESVKICDFGLSAFYDRSSVLKDYCGTPQCAPPEIMRGIPYVGPEVDIWCLGVILYAMVHGRLPFEDADISLMGRNAILSKMKIDGSLSDELKDLIRRIIEPDRSMRIEIDQIMKHPWINVTREDHRKRIIFIDGKVIERLIEIGFRKEDVLNNITDKNSREYSAYCLVNRKLLSGNLLLVPGEVCLCRPYSIVDLSFMVDEKAAQTHQRRTWRHEILRGMKPIRGGCFLPFLWNRRKMYAVKRDINLSLEMSRILIERSLSAFPKVTFRKKSGYTVHHSNGLLVKIELSEKIPFTTCTLTLAEGSKIEFIDFVVNFILFVSQDGEKDAAINWKGQVFRD
ncbi:serine/threonine protein kinase [Encephalitozoon intestinalis ATCC 50506]|uniref:Serine/threonine protein kinase n=1 Tax=Encephalitozoon intestinalis (strain ATCC 50506) TaxID=876142 RepID=E0S8E0_ENCIT|nr:serine/threonine protein kinase [Encephalitozoon intestinalis ATCC 50506]ADM12077.1 serine/threonine protein kinase [Encephalitozoon intestinalis ATCC 50506]UTX45869.1 5'-AMP-activated protein kinase catalytic subunit alpha-1 [Encephalitozoon intestinalis]